MPRGQSACRRARPNRTDVRPKPTCDGDFAKARGVEILQEFRAAVRGADPVTERDGFAAMLRAIASNGVRMILVENASRLARDLIVQETGFRYLQRLSVELIAVDSPDAFLDDTPTAVLIRPVLGAVAQFEKANFVAKLAAARKRVATAERNQC
jgi:DNA invertase Pin-like site-specific DNA recombinase